MTVKSKPKSIVRYDGSNWLTYHPVSLNKDVFRVKKEYGIFKDQFEELYDLAINRLNPGKSFLQKKQLYKAAIYISDLLEERYPELAARDQIHFKEILDNVQREYHNRMMRYQTCNRKVMNNPWNWFITLTYDTEKFTSEDDFLKSCKTCLNHLSDRRGWRYFGKIERGDERDRLHLHLVCYIPDGEMPGKLKKVSNRSEKKKRWRITILNTFFDEAFGWNEFSPIDQMKLRAGGFKYLTQYMAKDGERFIYGRHVPKQFEDDLLNDEDLERYEDGEPVIVTRYNTLFVVKKSSFWADPMTASLFNEESIEYYDS